MTIKDPEEEQLAFNEVVPSPRIEKVRIAIQGPAKLFKGMHFIDAFKQLLVKICNAETMP